MKPIYYLLILLTSLSCNPNKSIADQKTNTQDMEGRWYLVNRNNLRTTEIRSDSIHFLINKEFTFKIVFESRPFFNNKLTVPNVLGFII